jgi:transcriptional regulator with XRE-family HTH domain
MAKSPSKPAKPASKAPAPVEPAAELDPVRAINNAIGRRIRMLRVTHGHSQTLLGNTLAMTFQQVQKYERGANKISADKLWRLAQHYGVEIGYFFQDLEAGGEVVDTKPLGKRERVPFDRLRLELGREARQASPDLLKALVNVVRAAGKGTVAPDEE